jgi:hypothetical protein
MSQGLDNNFLGFLKDPAIAGISLISRGKTLQMPTRTCKCIACQAEKQENCKEK